MDEDDSQDELINRSSRGKGKRAAAWAISDNSDEAGSNEEADSESGDEDEEEEQLGEDDDDEEEDDEEEEDEEEEEEDGEAKPEEEGACAGTSADPELSSDEEAEKCPICLHSFSRQPVATPENCEHYFCLDCILEWSKNANSCPIDRTNFKVIYLRTCFGGKVQKMITIQKPAKQGEQDTVDLTLEETSCEVCGGSDREDRLLLCDGCDAGYHMECLTPPLNAVPVEEWFCPECEANNRQSRGSAAETSDTDSLPSTARTASSRARSQTVQTRAIARTQHSERVRANVNRHRITQARTQEFAPTYLIRSTWLDETINAVVAGLNSAMYVRDLTSRPSTRRRKSRKVKGRKTSSKSKMGKAGVKRRKRRVRRTKSRKKLVTRKTPTPRTRIASSLGIVKDKKSSSLPTVYRPSESTLSSMRADIGAASLSIYGDPFDLDPFTDREDDEQQAHNSLLLEAKRRGISRSAFRSHQPVARPVSLSRRPVSIPRASTVAEAAPVPDLLGSILSGQSMLLMDSSDVIINRDGSLKTAKPMSFTNRMPDSRSRSSSSGDGPQVSPGPLLDHMDSLGSSDGSLDRHFSNNSSPLSPPLGSTFTPSDMSHSVVAPRGNPSLLGLFSNDPNRPNQRVGRQLTNGVSESRQNSPSSTQLSSESSKSKASSQSLKAPTKPMWIDVSVLPRIPKIKKESSSDAAASKTGSNANKSNGSSSGSSSAHSHGLPDTAINRLAGDKERGHSVEQQHGRTAGPRNRPDGAGSSSGFSSSFSSSSSAPSHTNHQRFSSGSSSSSSVSFRINSSGNSWHSRRLNIASQTPSGSSLQEDFSEEEKKRQLHRDKQKLLASRSKDSNSIYDPFNPTESDSGSSDGESGGINVECSSRLKEEPVKLKNKVFSKSRWDLKQVKVETQSSHSQDKAVTTTTQETLTHQQKGTKVNTPFRKSRFSHIERPCPFNTVVKQEPESDADEEAMHALDSDTEDTTQTVQSLGLIKTELTVKEEPTPEPPAAPCDGNTLATSTASPIRESTSSPVRKSTSSSTKKSTSSPAKKSSSSPVTKSTSSPVRKSSLSPTRKVASSTSRKSASSPNRKSASSPSRKSASSPSRKSASSPSRKSASSPNRKSASSPSRKLASSPSRKSASSPSRKSTSSPSRKSASSPSRKSASSPGRKSASSPSRKSASSPSRKSASSPSRKSASSPSRKSASSPGRKSASSPSRKSASSPSRKSASSPSRKSASSPGRKSASSPSRKSASSPGRKSASSPGRKSASSPSRKSASSPSRKSASSPGRKSASSPGRKSASSPGRKSASSPGRKSASSPGRKSASSPGRKSASSPNRKSASSPSRKSASSPTRKSASSPTRKSSSSPRGTLASSPSRKSASSPSRKSASSPTRKSISSPVRKIEKTETKTETHKNQSKDLGSEKHTCKKNSSSKDLRARSSSTERARKPSSPDRDRGHDHTDSKHGASQKEKDKARSSRRSRSKERRTHRDSDSSHSKSPDRTSKKRRRSRSQSKDRRRRSRSHSSSSSRERSRTKKHKKQIRERNEDKDVKRRSSKDKRRDRSRSRSLSQSRSRSRSRERRHARSRSKSRSRSRSRSRDRGKTESCRQTSRDEAESRSKDKKRLRSRSNSKEKKKERSLVKTQKTSESSSSSVKDKDKSSQDKKKDDSSLIKPERASITNKVGSNSSMSSSTVKKEPMESKVEEKPIEATVKKDNPKTNIRKEKWTALDIFGESPTSSPIMKEELDIPITDSEIKCKEDTQIKEEECEAEKLGVTSPEMKPSVSDSPISSVLPTTVSSPPQYTAEQSTEGPVASIKQEPLPQSSDSDDDDFNVDVMLDNLALAKSRLEEPTVKDEKSDGEAAAVGAKSKAQVKRVRWNIEEPVGPQPEKSASKVALYKLKLKQEGIRRPSAHSTQDLTATASVGDVTSIDPERSLGSESSHALSASSQGQTDDGDFIKKDKTYLKKLHMQERAIEEVKLAIKPFYQKRDINKDEYKDILRKAVQKVCHSKSGEINPVKVGNLVKAYVDKYKHARKFKKGDEPGQSQEHLKLSDSP